MTSLNTTGEPRLHAPVFAALGDETRLSIVGKLSDGRPKSISQLTEGSNITRQAITKHLQVLENVGIVHRLKSGRETLFEFDSQPVTQAKSYLDQVSEQWDKTLSRLKNLLEE